MISDHLSDEQFQEYLDGVAAASELIERHLRDCPNCREALVVYKKLYTAIEQEPVPTLPIDFAEKIMARLPEMNAAPESKSLFGRFRVRDSFAALLGLAAVIIGAIMFIDLPSLVRPFVGTTALPHLPSSNLLQGIYNRLADVHVNPAFIIFAVLVVVGIGAIDHILAHREQHGKPVSYLI